MFAEFKNVEERFVTRNYHSVILLNFISVIFEKLVFSFLDYLNSFLDYVKLKMNSAKEIT